MALDARQAFKVAALARMTEEGLSPGEMLGRVRSGREKVAKLLDLAGKALGLASGAVGKGADVALGWGIPMALAAPPVVGGMAGMALSRATDIDDTDVDDIKDRELVDEYRRHAQRLWRNRAVRDYHDGRRQTGRVFFR